MNTYEEKHKPVYRAKTPSRQSASEAYAGQGSDPHPIMQLQNSIGNQAVQRMMQSGGEAFKATPADRCLSTMSPNVIHASDVGEGVQQPEHENNFKTWGTSGGLSGLTLDVTFSVNKTPASSLQAIQTVMCTGGPRKVGKFRWTSNGKTWDAFVDGGKNSPYVTIAGNAAAHPTKPYYLTPTEVANQVTFAKDTGTIRVYDRPAAATLWERVHFETAIVAVNYKNKKVDKVLKAFKWGWTGKGTKPTVKTGTKIAGKSSGISVQSGVSKSFLNIVKHDYPKYKLS